MRWGEEGGSVQGMHPRLPTPVALSIALATLACDPPQAKTHGPPAVLADGDSVEVVEIVKGDEVEVSKVGDTTHALARVRMLGVQAFSAVISDPELEKEGKAAEMFLAGYKKKPLKLVLGTPPKDAHGRYLGSLYNGAVDVNRQMVQDGLATVYTEFGFAQETEYLTAETEARNGKRGVWANPKTMGLMQGLRKQWTALRRGRGELPPADALLPTP